MKRSKMSEAELLKRSFCKAMVEIATQIRQIPTKEQMKQYALVIPHIKEAATTFNSWLIDEDLVEPSNRIAWFYEEQSIFEEAEKWYLYSCELVTEKLGGDHPDIATCLNNLALLYRTQGHQAAEVGGESLCCCHNSQQSSRTLLFPGAVC